MTGSDVEAPYFTNSSTVYTAVSGTIEVTKYSSSNFAGTFSFRAESSSGSTSRNVTDGKFNVNY